MNFNKYWIIFSVTVFILMLFVVDLLDDDNLKYFDSSTGLSFSRYAESQQWITEYEFALLGKVDLKKNFPSKVLIDQAIRVDNIDRVNIDRLLLRSYPDIQKTSEDSGDLYFMKGEGDSTRWQIIYNDTSKTSWLVMFYPDFSGDF
jgi:hypothetical protein